jgi:hypothetical protein
MFRAMYIAKTDRHIHFVSGIQIVDGVHLSFFRLGESFL